MDKAFLIKDFLKVGKIGQGTCYLVMLLVTLHLKISCYFTFKVFNKRF